MKVVYIGDKGSHSDNLNDATRGDDRFIACAVAGGTLDEDVTGLYEYIKEDHPGVKLYQDFREMLDVEKPDIAVVSPRFDLTARVCMECARRNVNVLAEKPIATSLEELEELRQVVKESGIHFMAMHFLRLSGAFYQALCAVRQGAIGKVRMVNAQKSYKLGKRQDFFKKRETYGGTILWVGVHAIDWIYAMIRKPCIKVNACQSCIGNRGHGELESTCLCQYIFEDEVMASLNIDYLRPGAAPTHSDDRLRVVGTEGVLDVQGGRLTMTNSQGEQKPEPEKGKNLSVEFLNEILGEGLCEIRPEEVFDIAKLAILTQQAADKGETVYWEV